MKKSNLARTISISLEENIQIAQEKKKEFENYLKFLEEQYRQGEISYDSYVETVYVHRNGKTIPELIRYLDHYIQDCENRKREQKKIIIKNQLSLLFFSLIFIYLYITISYEWCQ